MAKPEVKIYEIVALIEKHGPISPNRLTEITGDWRQTIDAYIRKAHARKMIHISGFGPSPFGTNREVKLYKAGKGVDAKRLTYRERRREQSIERIRQKRTALNKCQRDPLDAALFGAAHG
jgi:hypothetical protein